MRIQGKKMWIAGQFMAAQLLIEEGVIRQVLPYGAKEADEDYGDNRVLPGFIDIHTHGAYGYDTNDARPEGLREDPGGGRNLDSPNDSDPDAGCSYGCGSQCGKGSGRGIRGCADFGDPF